MAYQDPGSPRRPDDHIDHGMDAHLNGARVCCRVCVPDLWLAQIC